MNVKVFMEDLMHQINLVSHRKIKSLTYLLLLVLTFGFYAPTRADSLQVEFEHYFSTLLESFNTIANSSVLKKTRLYSMDRFFVSSLKKHQPVYSFIRTNSKGVIISEVIRGMTPERNFRKVRDQKWFRFVQRNKEDYHTLIKIKETGRYYLLWCKPVLKGNKYFVGAVAVKVDLWDCIHKISSNIDTPFLIRLGKKSLYSYRWKNIDSYDKIPLEIPGVKNISLLVKKEFVEEPVAAEAKPDTPAVAAAETEKNQQPAVQNTEVKKEKKPKKEKSFTSSKMFKVSLIFGIIVVIILIIVAVSYISRLRQRSLWQKIDEGKL
jgi:hypothetical protein